MMNEREKRLEEALAQFLRPIRGIPFEVIIKSICETSVEAFDPGLPGNQRNLELIVAAARDACRSVQKTPIQRPRPNEVGNDMEPFVIRALKSQGLQAAAARTRGGLGRTTGYPDVRIESDPIPIYLEVKTYAAATRETTMRSFYLSPAEDPKVCDDAHHLLVGFEVEREQNLFRPVGFTIVDLYGLDCDMKSEFNSDNRRLYQEDRILAHERVARALTPPP